MYTAVFSTVRSRNGHNVIGFWLRTALKISSNNHKYKKQQQSNLCTIAPSHLASR